MSTFPEGARLTNSTIGPRPTETHRNRGRTTERFPRSDLAGGPPMRERSGTWGRAAPKLDSPPSELRARLGEVGCRLRAGRALGPPRRTAGAWLVALPRDAPVLNAPSSWKCSPHPDCPVVPMENPAATPASMARSPYGAVLRASGPCGPAVGEAAGAGQRRELPPLELAPADRGIHRRPPPRPWAGGSTGSATSGGDGDPMAPARPIGRKGARPPRPPAEPATFDPTPLRQRGARGGRYAGRAARARRDSGNRARRDPGVAVGLRSRPADRVRRPSR